MKKLYVFLIVVVVIILALIGIFIYERAHVEFHGDLDDSDYIANDKDKTTTLFLTNEAGGNADMTYKQISISEAKQIFETEKDGAYIILDVRRADEFADGHIPGAINVANESINDEAPAELPDKNQTIYVYCRSGNRSKQAAGKLTALGYSNIIEFGGILDWTGEIEK